MPGFQHTQERLLRKGSLIATNIPLWYISESRLRYPYSVAGTYLVLCNVIGTFCKESSQAFVGEVPSNVGLFELCEYTVLKNLYGLPLTRVRAWATHFGNVDGLRGRRYVSCRQPTRIVLRNACQRSSQNWMIVETTSTAEDSFGSIISSLARSR